MPQFWPNVDNGETHECWFWQGYTDDDGYGYHYDDDGRPVLAHRWSVKLDGRDPDGSEVMHECDAPGCVNPAHLAIGNHAQNMADASDRGIMAVGEDRSDAKMSNAEVFETRQRYAMTDVLQTDLAEDYQVTQSHISRVLSYDHRQVRRPCDPVA